VLDIEEPFHDEVFSPGDCFEPADDPLRGVAVAIRVGQALERAAELRVECSGEAGTNFLRTGADIDDVGCSRSKDGASIRALEELPTTAEASRIIAR
jgi:hypothetical protein